MHTGYSGDGQFTDNGFMAYSRRYVIDLGPVDLSKPGAYKYKLAGMPRAEFNVSIRVFEGKRNQWDVQPEYPVSVRVQMQTVNGESVIFEEGSLNSWVRSFGVLDDVSDLYRRGESREIPLARGGSTYEPLGVKASGGWGTYFKSETNRTYILQLEVLSSENWDRPARVLVEGWDRA